MFNLDYSEYKERINYYIDNILEDRYSSSSFRFLGGVYFKFYKENEINYGACSIAVMDLSKDKVVDFSVYKGKILINNSSGNFYGVNEDFLFHKALMDLYIKPDIYIFEDDTIFRTPLGVSTSEYIACKNFFKGIAISKNYVPVGLEDASDSDGIKKKRASYKKIVSKGVVDGIFTLNTGFTVVGLLINHFQAYEILYIYKILDKYGYPKVLNEAIKFINTNYNENIHYNFLKNVCFSICSSTKDDKYNKFIKFLYDKGLFNTLKKPMIIGIIKDSFPFGLYHKDFIIKFFNCTTAKGYKYNISINLKNKKSNSKKISFPFDKDIDEMIDYYDKVFSSGSRENLEFKKDLKKKS